MGTFTKVAVVAVLVLVTIGGASVTEIGAAGRASADTKVCC
ncbi:MAG: hypothetical protein JWP74_3535 [Marmoricola sp.]|nr:hypothetical protein [Marmoricola sp.]